MRVRESGIAVVKGEAMMDSAAEEGFGVRERGRSGRGTRMVSAMLVGVMLALGLPLAGCGASDESSAWPEQTQASLPATTIEALTQCAKEGVGRLSRNNYEIGFRMEITEEGVVKSVSPDGKRMEDAGIEACMMVALRAMPASAATVEGFSASSVSHRVGGPTRGVLASTMLLPQSLELVPVVIGVSGVTIVVTVAVVVLVVAMASASLSPECQDEWDDAFKQCAEELQMNSPPRGLTGGYTDTKQCAKGKVSQECGGNRVDHGGPSGRPGRRW